VLVEEEQHNPEDLAGVEVQVQLLRVLELQGKEIPVEMVLAGQELAVAVAVAVLDLLVQMQT
jgi:hypothetical protein